MLFGAVLISPIFLTAQTGVGINTTTPTEELDVNGDVAIAGAIVPNGQTGTEGQILEMQSGGSMAWVDKSKYENFKTYKYSTSNYTWSWPTGVTEVMVEVWAGGGKGHEGGGGGAGGYGIFRITKTNNTSLTIDVGSGTTTSIFSQNSIVQYNSITYTAYRGLDASADRAGVGGSGAGSNNALTVFQGIPGQSGKPSKTSYYPLSATSFVRVVDYGNGGNSPLRPTSGGLGGMKVFNNTAGSTTSYYKQVYSSVGKDVGGGGGGFTNAGSLTSGGNGRVVLYW